jgi:hypothetical protein
MIIAHKSAFMQRIQEAAAHGYEWVITGSIDIHKFDNLYRKMNALYDVKMDKNRRYRAKKSGKCTCRFYATPEKDNQILWVVLATAGDGLFHNEEKRVKRSLSGFQVFGQYHLTRMTKKGCERPLWTFKLISEYKLQLIKNFKQLIHFKNDAAIRALLYQTKSFVHCAGVRRDLYDIYSEVKAAHERLRRDSDKIDIPFNHWNKKLSSVELEADKVIKRMRLRSETASMAVVAMGRNKVANNRL